MKITLKFATPRLLLLTLCTALSSAFAQGTAFTYQGRLNDSGSAANGIYDVRFAVYDAASNGNSVGSPLTNSATSASNGLFVAQLDFGAGVFNGNDRWLEIGVRTNGSTGAFTTLSPRQQITSTPYAIQSVNAANATVAASANSVSAANISGTLGLPQLPAAVVTNNETAINLTGAFTGNGGALTNISAGNVTGILSIAQLPAAVVTNNSANVSLTGTFTGSGAGLTNLNASQLKSGVVPTGVLPAFQSPYETLGGGLGNSVSGSYATVGGGYGNSATGAGATISGGGFDGITFAGNIASGGGAAVGGGNTNMATGLLSVVAGGNNNHATNLCATVPGGQFNTAGGAHSFAAGRKALATNDGAFVWADTTDANFGSAAKDSFNVRANGGARFITSGAGLTLDGQPVLSATSSIPTANISGTLALAQLPPAIVTNGATGVTISGTFTGSYSGNGGGLTGVNASNLTGVVSDFQLSTNVAMLRVPGAFTFNALAPITGVGGTFVTTMDINGSTALVTADAVNSVSILTNDGSGGFVLKQSIAAGSGADCVAVADIYGTGQPALISANAGNGTLTILSNSGGGNFVLVGSVPVGGSPASVIAADVNGDGKMDLISANNNNALAVLTNNGAGSFTLAQAPDVGSPAIFVTAADVNGDNKVDLVCARQGNSAVVLTNGNGGQFTLAQTFTALTGYPLSVAAADVNGDSKIDLITADGGGNTVSIFTNNGSGLLVLAQSVPAGNNTRGVATADVNGDGQLDLIGANLNDNTLSVLTNSGRGLFAFAQNVSVGNSPKEVLPIDANHDGRVDLISANSGDSTLSELLGAAVPNVPLFGASQTFTGVNAFTNAGNSFVGDGSGLSGLNASQLTSGTIPSARLSGTYLGAVTFNNAGNSFSGSGAGLTSLNANNLSSGTVADTRLSTNVPRLNTAQTFTARNTFNQGLGIGTASTLEGDVDVNTNIYLFSHAIYFRGDSGSDHNHGLAYNGQTITNFGTGNVQVDGPVLWGFTGGALAVMSGGAHSVLSWSNGAVAVTGNVYANGVQLTSDRNAKENFTALSADSILEKVASLPLSKWNYKQDQAKHIGPMAQDFHTAFGLNGDDDKHISVVDEGGVALAAIQGLNQKLELRSQNLESENAELKRKLAELQAIVEKMAQERK